MTNITANPYIEALKPYVPGKPISELMREYSLSDIIKLASNENPIGLSPKVTACLVAQASNVNLYPDGNGFALKNALADFYGVAADNVVLGNGSNDVLDLIARVYLNPETEAIFSEYAFAVYPIVTQLVGAKAVVVPAKNWAHDLVAMAAAITEKTRVVFVANPNNPTGTQFGKNALETFLSAVPSHVIVVLDEAYAEYIEADDYPQGIDYLSRYPNLIVTRTFSKIYGLAGLRVGYGLCRPEIANLLDRARQPFNVNLLAQEAAVVALHDQDFLAEVRVLNTQGLTQVAQGLRELGLTFIPSQTNFIAFDVASTGMNAGVIYEQFLQSGVIIRPMAGYAMPTFLRVSIGTAKQNDRFLTALADILAINSLGTFQGKDA